MAREAPLLMLAGILIAHASANSTCTASADGTLDRTSIYQSPGCMAECEKFLANVVCDAELITCVGIGTIHQELCQPQLSCTTSIADEGTQHLPANNTPGYLYNGSPSKVVKPYAPPLGDGPEWDAYNSYQTRCECADNQYGFDCTLVKSEQCPSGQVWDGTFRNLATPNKSYTCFLKSASLQSESMLPVLRTVRTNKMSIKIAATKNVQASTTLTVSMIGRFRPNNPMPNKSSCAIPDSTTLGLPYNCDFYGAEGADSCKVNKSADQSGHPYVFPSTVEVERASAECCSSAVEWLGVQMSCSISQCVGESGLVTYECQDILQINSTVPEQHRVEWSDWSDFLTRVKHGSVAFDTVDHKDGTSAASNMTLVDSTGEARTIQMQCMGGSCLEYSDLPKSWQGKHNSTTKYLNSTAGCEVDIPPPPGSARSSSTFVLIAIGAISLLAVNMLVAGVVFYRAHRLPGVVLLQPAKHQQEELLLPAGPGMLQDQHPPEQQQKPPPPPPGVAVPELGPPVGLVFEQVSYNVKGFGRTVVSEVSGCIQSHQMVAVLGPSGAGKSSMLDILASRPKVGQVNNGDSVRAFGEAGTLQRCKGIGYAMQDDFLCPDETVLESLMFAARIQLVGWADQRVHTQVNRVIDLLQLHKIANTKVGSSAEGGGISGGERKRVSIGVELVAAPSLLVLDEPTSGLDSASTAIVLQGLRAVSDAGCSTVFSIHQPPFEQFIQFDNVILMSRLGENIFTGSPESCVAYFQNLCGQEHLALPESVIASWSTLSSSPRGFTGNHGNPAEFLLSTASIKADETLHKLRDLFAQSTEFQQGVLLQISQAKAANQGVLSTPRDKSKPSSHGLKAFGLLTARATRAVVRNPSLFVSQMAVTLAIAGFIAALARNVPMDFTGVQTKSFLLNFLVLFQGMIAFSSLGSLITHKDIFVRERAAHLYPGWPYLLSKVITDFLPLRLLPSVLLSYIVYWSCGFRDDDASFGKFILTLGLGNCTSAAICFFIASVCSSIGTANLLSAAAVIYNFAFSGLLITSGTAVAKGFRYSSIFFYQWEALMAVEFWSGECLSDGSSKHCREFAFNPTINGVKYPNSIKVSTGAVLSNFSLEDRYGTDIFSLLMFCGGFLFLSALVLQFSKHRK